MRDEQRSLADNKQNIELANQKIYKGPTFNAEDAKTWRYSFINEREEGRYNFKIEKEKKFQIKIGQNKNANTQIDINKVMERQLNLI